MNPIQIAIINEGAKEKEELFEEHEIYFAKNEPSNIDQNSNTVNDEIVLQSPQESPKDQLNYQADEQFKKELDGIQKDQALREAQKLSLQ